MKFNLPYPFSCKRFLALFFCFQPVFLIAQLQADFTLDKSGGCSPLNVSFTSTTTGASANAGYHWDFGNGNTSSLKNTGAVFYEERQYTVTLTVTDGSQTSVKTRTLTVYKKPSVDFTFSPGNGCMPMPVSFNGSSSGGDGNIASWQWDFGDGTTQQVFGSATAHTYTFEQTAIVNLTATSQHGCTGTLTKAGIITVKKPLLADFTADKTIACFAPATVSFTNSSTGPGTLSYYWEFGDGGTSTQAAPVYTYTQKGTYSVKLTVTSSEGCVKEITRAAYINVEDFITDFTLPAPICSEQNAVFNNISAPLPSQNTWLVDGSTTYITYGNDAFSHYFAIAGTHTVQLTTNFGPCQRSITKTIEVKKTPEPKGFIADIAGLCGAPVQVNFSDTTAGAVSWLWDFDRYNSSDPASTLQSPSYTYTSDNSYTVRLTVTTADGCSAATSKAVGISRPLVGVFIIPEGSPYSGCAPFTTQFEYRATEALTSFQWNFGDGNTSSAAAPAHTFPQPGDYTVSFTYTTINGCTGTVTYNPIKVFQKPVADFTVQPGICGNNPVTFTNTSTGTYSYAHWDFGDNTGWQYGTNTHQYQEEGEYTVTLMLSTFFYECGDTITKPAIIKVLPPFAKINALQTQNTCDGDRGLVTFSDDSRKATGWHWDFGDGSSTSYSTAQPTVPHSYTASGSYKVVLTVTNGSCAVKDSTFAQVLLKNQPVLSFDAAGTCVNQWIKYNITGLDLNPHQYYTYWQPYGVVAFVYDDGTQVPGIIGYDGTTGTSIYGRWKPELIKEGKVRAIIRSTVFNCYDTTNYVDFTIKGSQAGFEIVTAAICFKSPVVLRDTSHASAGTSIVSWQWNFGDGNVETYSQGGTVSHQYNNPGYYYVNLKITDATGCTSNSSVSQFAEVSGPKAAFYSSGGSTVQLNTTITFYNNSNTYQSPNTSWQWDFGNGATSTAYSPAYTFTAAGDYMVTLIAENPQTGCKDTARQLITVKNFNTGFTTNVSFVGDNGQCPPVLARFYNTSVNYTRLVWDFGDGTILENQTAPSHIYNMPGTYIVELKVYGYNGLTGTYRDTIHASRPVATINANDIDGCIGQQVLLHAPEHSNAVSYYWDFGNGYTANATDSFAIHQFQEAGAYTASLIVKDVNGCRSLAVLPDKIVIYPNPVAAIQPAAPVTCKETPVSLQASGGVSYLWTPAAGLNDNTSASPLALPPVTTPYQVTVTDENGCKGNASVTVTVPQPFTIVAAKEYDICKGDSVQLNASGAETYQWINTTTALSNTAVPNPVASPPATASYTLVGHDQYQCYTDTVDIKINVRPIPTVNAGPDRLDILFGSENVLTLNTSNDVVKWHWTPADFLSCTNCPAPVSKPYAPVNYIITVYTAYDCIASDTLSVKAICNSGAVYIPSAFTPNNDGKNDLFTINGAGVGLIRSFRIYDRWGNMVFERKNFYQNDISAAWNGRVNGLDAPGGVYVYFAEMECNAGEVFYKKGTVTLIR